MDVLQVIKEEHESIRDLLGKVDQSGAVSRQKQVISELLQKAQQHIRMEGEYLYPEINGLFHEANNFIKISCDNHKNIKKKMNDVEKLLKSKTDSAIIKKKLGNLASELDKHFHSEENLLMPKLRQLISTQDREDLGQVFLDFRETAAANMPLKGKRAKS